MIKKKYFGVQCISDIVGTLHVKESSFSDSHWIFIIGILNP